MASFREQLRKSYRNAAYDLTTTQAAKRLRCSPAEVRRLIHTGELRAYRWGNEFRIPEESLAAYLRRHAKPQASKNACARARRTPAFDWQLTRDSTIDGATIKAVRVDVLGITQERLGELLGQSNITIYRWETGRASPEPYIVYALLMLAMMEAGRVELFDGRVDIMTSAGKVAARIAVPPDLSSALAVQDDSACSCAGAGAIVFPQGMTLAELERAAIGATLRETGGNREAAATILGIGRRTLYRKLRAYRGA